MPENKKRIVIIGATSAIAEQCARLWVQERSTDITLVGRQQEKTERVAADLRVRSPKSEVHVVTANFVDPTAISSLVDTLFAQGPIDTVLIAHGSLPDQAACQSDAQTAYEALNVNGMSPVLFAERFVGHMLQAGSGTVGIIGSVAGERGRKSNYVYGAAKGLVTRYAEGLQHRLAATRVKVVLIKPGPTSTPMTAHMPQKGMAPVEDVAKRIVAGMKAGSPVVYAPAKWALIMFIIGNLPRFVFNKMDI